MSQIANDNHSQKTFTIAKSCLKDEHNHNAKNESLTSVSSGGVDRSELLSFKRERLEQFDRIGDEDRQTHTDFLSPLAKIEPLIDDFCFRNICNFQKEITSMCLRESFPEHLIFPSLSRNGNSQKIIPPKKPEDKKRKFSTDSLHKRIKRIFISFIQKNFSKHFTLTPPKVPKHSVSNVTIKYNKIFLEMSVKEFYLQMCGFDLGLYQTSYSEDQEVFLNCKIKDCYKFYTKNFLENDLKKLKEKESEQYCEKIRKRSLAFLDYYTYLKPFQKKLKR